MKILVVSQYYYPEPFRITDICETLVKKGHQVTVLTGQPNYPNGNLYNNYNNEYCQEIVNGVSIVRTKIHPRGKGNFNLFINYLSFPYYSRKAIRKLDSDYDIVFINQLSPIFSAKPGIKYAKKHKKKTILYCLDLWPESLMTGGIKSTSLVYKIFGIISKKIYRKADKVLITSKSFADKFDAYKIITEYLPQYAEDNFSEITESPKFNNEFHCTFAGNIGEMQSVETIILAAKELQSYNDIVFDIFGNGSKFDDIKSLLETHNLKNVKLHGRKNISEMPEIYRKSDVLLVTLKKNDSISMTLPGKVQTYLASGKPIIGAIDGEANLVIQESGAGYVCPAEDYITLSQLILKAKENTNLAQIGQKGRKYYFDNFSKNKFINKLENIFLEEGNV